MFVLGHLHSMQQRFQRFVKWLCGLMLSTISHLSVTVRQKVFQQKCTCIGWKKSRKSTYEEIRFWLVYEDSFSLPNRSHHRLSEYTVSGYDILSNSFTDIVTVVFSFHIITRRRYVCVICGWFLVKLCSQFILCRLML